MYSVRGIIERLGLSFHCLGKDRVEGNKYVSILFCKLLYNGNNSLEVVAQMHILFGIKVEGADHNDLCISSCLDYLKKRTVVDLKLFVGGGHAGAMPCIVDAYKYRNDVGIEIGAICSYTVEELTRTVATDTHVDELDVHLGVRLFYVLCGEADVAVTQLVIIALISAAVGDAVTLKYDLHNGFPFRYELTLRSRRKPHRMRKRRCTRQCRYA